MVQERTGHLLNENEKDNQREESPIPKEDPAPVDQDNPAVPTVIIQPAPRGSLSRLLSRLGWLLFVICLLMLISKERSTREYFDTSEGILEHYHSLSQTATDKVAILDIEGVIGSGSYAKRQIDRIARDTNIVAIVLRVNSPGGTVTGSDYIYHHLKKLKEKTKLPIVVSMGGIAASGGYYVSMAVGSEEDSIFAEPTTTTGSIGVIIPHYDLSGLMARFDIKDDSVFSHERKQILSMTQTMPAEHRAILQDHVNDAFKRFKQIVMAGRPALKNDENILVDTTSGRNLATGEVFTANMALQYGLIDRIGFIEDAIQRAIELARQKNSSLDPDNIRVVRYDAAAGFLDFIPLIRSQQAPNGTLEALLELSIPRRYYLSTTLPALIMARDPD
jgi:protease-4